MTYREEHKPKMYSGDFDISWCTNESCKRKDTCNRYLDDWARKESVRLNEIYLSMFMVTDSDKCDNYWDIEKYYS